MTDKWKYKLRVKAYFEASHSLSWHDKCSALHGHTYHVEVVIASNQLNENGVVIDLGTVSKILEELLPDHCHLNDWIDNPTVERIADKIHYLVRYALTECGHHHQPQVAEVTVWESPTGGVTVYG